MVTNKKGLLDDLLSKIEHGELGPKKTGLQKKGAPRASKKSGPHRQLSSVDEDKLKEPNPLNSSNSRFPNNMAPLVPPKTTQQQLNNNNYSTNYNNNNNNNNNSNKQL